MRRLRVSTAAASALLGLGALILGHSSPATAADGWRARVSARLLAMYDAAARARSEARGSSSAGSASSSATAASPASSSPFAPRVDANGRVQIDVRYDCGSPSPRAALISAGLSIDTEVHVPPLCIAEGWAAPAALASIASIGGVTSVTLPSYALPPHPPPHTPATAGTPGMPAAPQTPTPRGRLQSQSGAAIDGNGVAIMRADQFVLQTGDRGTGVTVGVQSTGVASLALIQQRGELPSVRVLTPSGNSSPAYADEGTALLEEVHAVAPGANLAFCGPNTFVEYTACLQQLIGAGATILADDVIFPAQDLMSASDTDTQAIESLLSSHPSVALFTAVGNYNGSYWEGPYTPVSLASQGLGALTCPLASGSQSDAYVAQFDGSPSEQLTVTQGSTFQMMFAWADPPDANVSRFDVYWSNNADASQTGCFSTAGVSGNLITQSVPLAAGTYTLYVATPDTSAASKFMKLWFGGDGLTFLSAATPGAIVSAQAYATGAITIGATNGSDGIGDQIESFSSLGPLSVVFPTPQQLQAPTLVAPDGIYVDAAGTYFAGSLFPDGNFYGTSASVPNAAAVAALLRGAFPTLTVPQLVQTLTAGAAQLGGGVPDAAFGYGRIDALGALGTLPGPTITALPDSSVDAGSSTSALPFSIAGTGTLHFTVTSSNPSLVPARIVTAGAPGVTIAPTACGAGVSSCTATITAAAGAGGTTSVTLYAVDGANRSAPAAMTVTVNGGPPSATSSPPAAASTGSPAKGGGGAFGWSALGIFALLTGANAAARMRRTRALSRLGCAAPCD